jgi:hypothetical protein
MWPPMGKFVPQLSRVVTFAYDLYFRCVIARWKGLSEKYTLSHQKSYSVYNLTMVSQKNNVEGPKTALEVQQDVLT